MLHLFCSSEFARSCSVNDNDLCRAVVTSGWFSGDHSDHRRPTGVSADGAGGFYVSSSQNRVYHVGSDGTLTVIAGNGSRGFSGDNGLALSAQLNYVHGVAADSAGNVFIADTNNNRIQKVTPAGFITTVAGTGTWGSGGDGGPAVSSRLSGPRGVAVDQAGNLFIADTGNNEIRMVTAAGVISTVAGNGTAGFSGDAVRVIPADGGAPPIPLVLFSYKPGGTITVSQAGVPSTTGTAFRVYVEFSGTDGQPGAIQSGIAMANNTFTPVTVTLELTNLDGSSTNLPGPVSQTLPGFGHIGQFLNQAFPGVPGPFKGILRISAPASGVSVIGLRSRYNERGDFLITTTPPASETALSSSAEFVLPHLPDGGGYTTEVILFSGSAGQSSSGSLLLFQQAGQPFAGTLR